MIERIRTRLNRTDPTATPPEEDGVSSEYKPLRILAAELLVLTSIDIALATMARSRREPGPPYPHGSPGPRKDPYSAVASWVPAALAPLAAAAQLSRAVNPGPATYQTSRVFNGVMIGAGAAGLIDDVLSSRRQARTPSLSPLALASAGVLGLILDREEERRLRERQSLERRAALVERLVPKRRARIDRLVVHV